MSYIKELRELLKEKKIRVLFVGSRTRGVSLKTSDFDLFAIADISDKQNDDIELMFSQHIKNVNNLILKKYPDAHVPEGGRWLVFERGGYTFSVIPKLQIDSDKRSPILLNRKGNIVQNNPIQAIIDSKKKERDTNGRFRETVIYTKKFILNNYNFSKGGFIIESLFAHVDDQIFLTYDNMEERLINIVNYLLNLIERDSLTLNELGSNTENIFKTGYIKKMVIKFLNQIRFDLTRKN